MDFTRQKDIFNPEASGINIKILGVGSVGSFLALTLAKMGVKEIKITDFDSVEKHNIPNQFYREDDVKKKKTEALKEIIKEFTGLDVESEDKKILRHYEEDLNSNSIVMLCVDNIKTRTRVYESIKDYPIILIDTRMGGEEYQIYTIDLSNEEDKRRYEATLKRKTKEAPCGQKAIIYCILSIASEVCNIVKKIGNRETYPKIIKRDLHTYKILSDQNE